MINLKSRVYTVSDRIPINTHSCTLGYKQTCNGFQDSQCSTVVYGSHDSVPAFTSEI